MIHIVLTFNIGSWQRSMAPFVVVLQLMVIGSWWTSRWMALCSNSQSGMGGIGVPLGRCFHFGQAAKAALRLPTLVLTVGSKYSQRGDVTCGTALLQHLGWLLHLWQPEDAPAEDLWHEALSIMLPHGTLCGFGPSDAAADSTVLWPLRDLLHQHGVPEDRTEERALAALTKIGEPRIREALSGKNPWAALKALGSAPRVNFLFVKSDELQRQIQLRAQSRFKASASNRKTQKTKAQPAQLDPRHLALLDDTFVDEDGDEVGLIPMMEVAKEKTGIAFGTVEDSLPFLREDRSISTGPLALLTTKPIPASVEGLLPTTHMRYPALYVPTEKPILVDGTLIQLGDVTVSRKLMEEVEMHHVPTKTVKITV